MMAYTMYEHAHELSLYKKTKSKVPTDLRIRVATIVNDENHRSEKPNKIGHQQTPKMTHKIRRKNNSMRHLPMLGAPLEQRLGRDDLIMTP
jgi:hypothetical protein